MAAPEAPVSTRANYHVLLIGVDDYPMKPLAGCVNDIDAVQRVLLGPRMAIPKDRIRRLASPRPGTTHETEVAEKSATLDNIRAALAELGSDNVCATDRVFIYYSGHGKQVVLTGDDGRTFHREALVPVDFLRGQDPCAFLFDFEVNELLRAIVARTRSVAVMLDSCHAAGAFRDGVDPPDSVARSLDLGELDLIPRPDPAGTSRGVDDDAGWLGRGIEACHLVAACLANESARETSYGGLSHGMLTRAFIAALEAAADPDLSTITWARIWQTMRTEVMRSNPWQTPRMEGNLRRIVFAGPPVDGDPGIAVFRDGDRYRIEAGTMADVTKGAELAIYGEQPAYFPDRDSAADLAARVGVVCVDVASLATAEAAAVGAPFAVSPGARGRLVKAGELARLRCAVKPANREIAALLASSALLELVGPDDAAPVRLELHDGRWLIIDDQHGTGSDAPVLFALRPDDIASVRAVLEHYYDYSLPLRVAQRAAADLTDGLELRLLSCPDGPDLSAEQAQAAKLPEASLGKDGRYQLRAGARVCVYLRNRSTHLLKVGLFNAAAGGEVQLLGDEIIEPGAFHVFWARGELGVPYKMWPLDGADRSRDRLVAIGRTSKRHELDYLRVDRTFADIVEQTRGGHRRMDDSRTAAGPIEHWTAAQAVIEISRT